MYEERNATRAIMILTTIAAFTSLSGSLVRTLFSIYLDLAGFPATYIGLIAGGMIMIPLLFSLPAGMISDRYNRELILMIALMVMAPLMAAIALIKGIWIALIVFALGICASLYSQSIIALLAEVTQRSRRATAFGIYYAALNLSMTIGAFMSGLLVETIGYEMLFLLSSLFTLIAAIIAIIMLKTRCKQNGDSDTMRYQFRASAIYEVMRSSRRLRNLLLAILVHDFFVFMAVPFVALFAKKILGINEAEIGMLLGLQSIIGAFLQPLVGRIADRVGGEALLIVHVVSTGALYALYGMSRDIHDVLLIMILLGIAFSLDMPARRAMLSEVAPRHMLATVNGMADTLVGIGALFSPLLSGMLWDMGLARDIFIIGGLLNMGAVVFLLALMRSRSKDQVVLDREAKKSEMICQQ
ncbi:MAG: hypothetical protein DRN15_10735 [Thermoprotei archaeon]|nr:MAG: hypothetical protein DRN15_10735 [Thermoprotei archaeon]